MLLLLLLAAPAQAQDLATIRPFVQVEEPMVRLSDLFEGAGPRASTVLGPAPAPGTRMVIEAAQLAAIARQQGIAWRPVAGVERVVLERPGRPVAREEVMALLRAALRHQGLDEDAEVELMMTTRPDGAPSRTRYRVLERFAAASLVQFDIETGRQHQIRVHARAIGHPVLLDALYGDDAQPAWPGVIARQALHARKVVLPHPRTGAPLVLEAPLPDDFLRLLAALRG